MSWADFLCQLQGVKESTLALIERVEAENDRHVFLDEDFHPLIKGDVFATDMEYLRSCLRKLESQFTGTIQHRTLVDNLIQLFVDLGIPLPLPSTYPPQNSIYVLYWPQHTISIFPEEIRLGRSINRYIKYSFFDELLVNKNRIE